MTIETQWGDNQIDLAPILGTWQGGEPNYAVVVEATGGEATEIYSSESGSKPSVSFTPSW